MEERRSPLNNKPCQSLGEELPIRADYVGKNYPTSMNEHIHVHVEEVDGEDAVLLVKYKDTE